MTAAVATELTIDYGHVEMVPVHFDDLDPIGMVHNARHALLSVTNAIVGIDLADAKQMVVATDHESKVLARKTFPCRAWDVGASLEWAAERHAVGVATFKQRADGTQLQFKVNVANLDNAVAAHIHCGAVGVNGPVGVTLFGGAPGGGAVHGTLAKGTITAPDPGNGCGWTSLAVVLAAMDSGSTYVNVHTDDGVPPINTGPGDFPGGEIRGQVG
jgi:hypothetical protein